LEQSNNNCDCYQCYHLHCQNLSSLLLKVSLLVSADIAISGKLFHTFLGAKENFLKS